MGKAWRITQKRFSASAFDGIGARDYGGRWNHIGTPMVYAAGSLSLATLEILVHLDETGLLLKYCHIPVEYEDSLCRSLDPKDLPADWQSDPAPNSTKDIGTHWAKNQTSVILAVPSTIIPVEVN
jgi:RES domain-containing protein